MGGLRASSQGLTRDVSAADIVQLVIAVATASAAVAAWIAAISSRESARETAVGQLIAVHSQRLNSLARLHSTLAWISEGGGPRKSLTYMERVALMTWHPIGTIVVRGIEFRGMIETTGLDLPFCRQVAEAPRATLGFSVSVPVREAHHAIRKVPVVLAHAVCRRCRALIAAEEDVARSGSASG